MKRINTIILCTLLTLFFASCEEDKVGFEQYGSLSGVVVDGETYQPLEGVLIATSPASSSIITSTDGQFTFPKVQAGEVTVTARKKDYLSNNVLVSVHEDEKTEMTMYLVEDDKDYGSVTIFNPVPGNGAVNQLESFTMEWEVDQSKSSISLTYDVFLFESNSTTQMLVGEGLAVTEVVVDNLKDNTTYYWYVVAKYDGDIVTNSPTWTFRTGNNSN